MMLIMMVATGVLAAEFCLKVYQNTINNWMMQIVSPLSKDNDLYDDLLRI